MPLFTVRPVSADDTDTRARALDLAWRVFDEDVLPESGPGARDTFRAYIYGDALAGRIDNGDYRLYVATLGDELIGMMLVRARCHIAALFTDGAHRRMGVGGALINEARSFRRMLGEPAELSVNASPGGLPFYERMGFTALGPERMEDGIRFTPMGSREGS